MARVIVLPNAEYLAEGLSGPVLLDERVDPVSLEDEHSRFSSSNASRARFRTRRQ